MENLLIELIKQEDEEIVINLIRRNLDNFEEAGSVLAATFRRLENFYQLYTQPGAAYFIAKDTQTGAFIGGAGLGPLAGLPTTDGIGEIRELIIDESYRNQGIGGRLLEKCLAEAKRIGYKRIYLETTSQMQYAQRLFRSFGFHPITQKNKEDEIPSSCTTTIPCYFMLER